VIGRDCLGNIAGKPIELIGRALSEEDRVWPKYSSADQYGFRPHTVTRWP
jgi:hypothetical protein